MSDRALQAVQKISSLQGTYNIVLTFVLTNVLTTVRTFVLQLRLLIYLHFFLTVMLDFLLKMFRIELHKSDHTTHFRFLIHYKILSYI